MSDTSPITNLIQIGKLDLLKVLFGKVIIPQKIYQELSEYENQQVVVDRNDWIEVRTIEREEEVGLLQKELDDGEAEAIVLAKEVNAHFLIVDERKGRLVASIPRNTCNRFAGSSIAS